MPCLRAAARTLLLLALGSAAAAQGLFLGPDPAPVPLPVPLPAPSPAPLPLPPDQRPQHPVPLPARVRATSLRIQAALIDGVATTDVRQVFRNDGDMVEEGTWLLPIPAGAAADRFTMTIDGREVPGEVLTAAQARQVYEDIVRAQRDPGLLEYLGTGCLRARIFPIPPRGEVTVLVRYREVLARAAGLHQWTYALRAAGLGGGAPEKLSVDVTIRSRTPLKNVYSPLPGADVQRKSDHEARLTLETATGRLPERDVTVFYGLSEADFGLHLLAHRRAHEPGYFLMLLAPKHEWPEPANTRRVITFVLDTSGSMQGQKIEQARAALRFFLRSLRPIDLFNVVPFSTEARPFFAAPVPAGADNVAAAVAKTDEIEARGGTNIEDGLRVALAQAPPAAAPGTTSLPIVVFLTDGLPTVGTTDVEQLLAQVAQGNAQRARIFAFGVGHDVNSRLLDRIAEDSRGERDYVREDESIEVKTGDLFTKLSHPVMSSVELTSDIDGFDLFPRRTPDLFKGSRLLVAGRYRGDGARAIRLKGIVNGAPVELVFEATFPAQASEHDFVPPLWAERKVAFLLDQIRLNGHKPELVDEVTRLGKEFGIVTPFTSNLIVEEGMRIAQVRGLAPQSDGRLQLYGFDGFDDDVRRVYRELARAGAVPPPEAADAPAAGEALRRLGERADEEAKAARDKLDGLARTEVGRAAVDNSLALRLLQQTPTAAPAPDLDAQDGSAALMRRRIKDRTFYLAGGVWVDSAFREEMRPRTHKVAAFSADYFALRRERPEVAAYLAFSTRLLLVLDNGEVVEVE